MSDAPNALPSTRLSQISPKDETLDEDEFDDMAKEGMASISIMALITVHTTHPADGVLQRQQLGSDPDAIWKFARNTL